MLGTRASLGVVFVRHGAVCLRSYYGMVKPGQRREIEVSAFDSMKERSGWFVNGPSLAARKGNLISDKNVGGHG